jgi:hypothetical protein
MLQSSDMLDKISTLTVQEEPADKTTEIKIELVFFLTETFDHNFQGLCKEI